MIGWSNWSEFMNEFIIEGMPQDSAQLSGALLKIIRHYKENSYLDNNTINGILGALERTKIEFQEKDMK